MSLQRMLGCSDLTGKAFIDVGSGSGLFSLAARSMGARVFSFDYDPESVACTEHLKERFFPTDPNWTVSRGSILDREFLKSLGTFDVVYSWGVLHHTGAMWEACANVDLLARPGTTLFIAIYNDQGWPSRAWKRIKRWYVSSNCLIQLALLFGIGALSLIARVLIRMLSFRNPFSNADSAARQRQRGMNLWHDHVDWIGGYPFEVAKPEEIFEFFHSRGYALEKLVTKRAGQGCCEYVFVKGARDASQG